MNTNKPVCPNCQQWQHEHAATKSGDRYLDCFNECAARGFARIVWIRQEVAS